MRHSPSLKVDSYSFSVEFTLSCAHNILSHVLCLPVQEFENSQLNIPPFFPCLTCFSLFYETLLLLSEMMKRCDLNIPQRRGCMLYQA